MARLGLPQAQAMLVPALYSRCADLMSPRDIAQYDAAMMRLEDLK